MNIIYVDDSKINCIRFEKEIRLFERIKKLTIANSAEQALTMIRQDKPDLAILDIEMPGKSGTWLAEQLLQYDIPFAFLTSHNNFANEAFSLSALYYLLKPVTHQGLSEVFARFDAYMKQKKGLAFSETITSILSDNLSDSVPKRIFLNNIHKTAVLNIDDILYLTAAGSYTLIKTIETGKFTSSKTMAVYVDMLAGHTDFIKIHRSHMVNKKYVKAVLRNKHKIFLLMADKAELEVSPALRDTIFDLLQL